MDIETKTFYENLPALRARLALLADGDQLPDGTLEGEVKGFQGLIYVEHAVSPNLRFTVGPWQDMSTDPAQPDKLKVWISTSEDIDPDRQLPFVSLDVVAPPEQVSINIPIGLRPEGIHWLMIEVFSAATFNTSRSIPQPLVIDRTAPYTGYRGAIPAPVRPADMPASAGKDYFDSHGGVAQYTIPDYPAYGKAPGDWVLVYLNGSDTPAQLMPIDPTDPQDPAQKWVLPDDLSFPLSWDVVASLLPGGVGPLTVRYELYDAAGNPARLSSSSLPVTISNLPDPELFLPPTIDRAVPGDNLVDRNDTALDGGMILRVPEYKNFVRGGGGDAIIATVMVGAKSVTLPAVPLGSTAFPVPIQVTLAQLLTVYDVAQGPVPMTVSYLVQRGTSTFPLPPTPAPSTSVNLDLFFAAGPEPTDPPSLVNNDLLPPHLYGQKADGTYEPTELPTNPGVPNPNTDMLTREHANRPAQARVTLWSKPPLPGVSDFLITLFYAGKQVSETPVSGGTPGQVINIPVPWSLIQAEGNGTKTLSYKVSATGTNFQLSPQTSVDVQANFKYLAAPLIKRLAGASATSQGAVNCDSFLPKSPPGDLDLTVPPSEFFVAGDKIKVTIQGYSDNLGTVLVPGATVTVETPPWNAVTYRDGIPVKFSNYLQSLKLVQPDSSKRSVGSLRAFYEANLVPEGLTKSDEARPAARVIRVGTGGYFYCDGTATPLP
ncbi:MAG: hypothetical protein ACK418_11245 [Pseudomonas sp.]|uniref:hypothetical protein n=1 Tax=Pseudomonas sp. TaxID=306 RepID=UPI00391A6D2A